MVLFSLNFANIGVKVCVCYANIESIQMERNVQRVAVAHVCMRQEAYIISEN